MAVDQKSDFRTMSRSCCVDPMKTVCIDPKSDLKITNICFSDTIQSTLEGSRVSMSLNSGIIYVSILKPFQVYIARSYT